MVIPTVNLFFYVMLLVTSAQKQCLFPFIMYLLAFGTKCFCGIQIRGGKKSILNNKTKTEFESADSVVAPLSLIHSWRSCNRRGEYHALTIHGSMVPRRWRAVKQKVFFCLMYATTVFSTMALSATENLENHIVGGTSRMTTGCKKSSPRGWEISVPIPQNTYYQKINSSSTAMNWLGSRSLFLPLYPISPAYGTEYLVHKGPDPQPVSVSEDSYDFI